jgi:hypothetical protein
MKAIKLLFGLIMVVLLLPAASAYFEANGWHEWLWGLPSLIYDTALSVFGVTWFPWLAGMMMGVSIGVLGNLLFLWLIRDRPTDDKEIRNLSPPAYNLSQNISFATNGLHPRRNLRDNGISPKLQGELESFFADLQRYKIPVPNLDGMPPHDALTKAKAFIDYVINFLKRGDCSLVQEKSKSWIESKGG